MGVKKLKARINYRSKRTIIIISIAVVLLIAAIAGTVAFVKGNRDSAAAMTDDNPGTHKMMEQMQAYLIMEIKTMAVIKITMEQHCQQMETTQTQQIQTIMITTVVPQMMELLVQMVPMDLQLGQQMEQTQALMLEQQQELQQQVTMVQTFQTKITHKQQQL